MKFLLRVFRRLDCIIFVRMFVCGRVSVIVGRVKVFMVIRNFVF